MTTLADGTPYKENMTVWQWVFMPISPPIIQSLELSKLELEKLKGNKK